MSEEKARNPSYVYVNILTRAIREELVLYWGPIVRARARGSDAVDGTGALGRHPDRVAAHISLDTSKSLFKSWERPPKSPIMVSYDAFSSSPALAVS